MGEEWETLIQFLQKDVDGLLEELSTLSVITEEDYEYLDKLESPVKKTRRLLILIQKKGEPTYQQFLECLENMHPNLPEDLHSEESGECSFLSVSVPLHPQQNKTSMQLQCLL
ncbi:caspase recruitment domain family member 6 [Chelydra serpentina]|uniref:Caspase recruitment domain family member 6 n=1 Tax=Chelydra serpentina TaxID=8475 RepID=A0A8T1SD80_CHESE|nr:caspase recruitment domain family member 6 [Chelydra serpentina]